MSPSSGSRPPARPVRLGVLDEAELVTHGLRGMLRAHGDRVALEVLTGPATGDVDRVDVVLCDPFSDLRPDDASSLARLADLQHSRVIVFTWNTTPSGIRRALEAGAHGYLAKTVTSEELVAAVEAAHRGEPLPGGALLAGAAPSAYAFPGLSARESEVLALICRGLSNLEIAQELFVSVNSVKTYIRQVYQKAGVSRRTQAVAWAHRHGYAG